MVILDVSWISCSGGGGRRHSGVGYATVAGVFILYIVYNIVLLLYIQQSTQYQ
jgi:hypothetical protein